MSESSLLTLSLFIKRVNKERNYMIIKKICIGNNSEVRISKDVVNGKAFIQIKVWEKDNGSFKPTNRPIVLIGEALIDLINGLELSQYLESDMFGET